MQGGRMPPSPGDPDRLHSCLGGRVVRPPPCHNLVHVIDFDLFRLRPTDTLVPQLIRLY